MIVFLMGVLVFLVSLSYAVEAKETIDLQKYVSCSLTSCQLSVDINELTLSSEGKTFLKNIKKGDLDAAVSGLPSSLSDFTVTVKDKEKLIVTAEIEPGSDNYWYIEFTDFILDPWFNSSYKYRLNRTLKNTVGIDIQARINLTIPTGQYMDAGYLAAGCVGLTFAYDNGTVIPYDLEGCGTNYTQIYMTPEIAADNSTVIHAYLDNESASLEFGSGAYPYFDVVYTFPEGTGTSTDDRVGNNNGGYNNGQGWANGFFGNATACDGDDSYIGSQTPLGNMESQYQIEGWTYIINTSGGNPGVWSKGTYPGDTRQWILIADIGTPLLKYRETNATTEYLATYSGAFVNAWHYVVNRWNGTYMDIFFDGALQNSAYLANPTQQEQAFSICRHKGGTEDNVGGYVDMFAYSTDLISNQQIKMTYDYAKLSDATTGWGDIELNGTETPPETPSAPALNYTYTVNIDLNNAPAICLADNVTRYRYTTINGANINETYVCPNGCDNVTMDCIPPVYQQNIYILFGFAAVMIIAVWLLRRK